MKDFKTIEENIKNDIEAVFSTILSSKNYVLPISARARGGAEISDYLEDSIVEYYKDKNTENVYNVLGAPKEKTKNPYDFCFNYRFSNENFDDLIWADIKASKHTYEDSNPDLGTPEKIIKFINEGHFYLLFVFFEYEPTDNNQTKFIPFSDGKYVHCVFLKDIHHTVRINPKPQFQVNISESEEYRSIDEFIDLFQKKYQESLDRIVDKAVKKRNKLDTRFDVVKQKINDYQNR